MGYFSEMDIDDQNNDPERQHKHKFIVLDIAGNKAFQEECNKLDALGYRMESSSCGFLPSAEYDYVANYQAVFVYDKPPAMDREEFNRIMQSGIESMNKATKRLNVIFEEGAKSKTESCHNCKKLYDPQVMHYGASGNQYCIHCFAQGVRENL